MICEEWERKGQWVTVCEWVTPVLCTVLLFSISPFLLSDLCKKLRPFKVGPAIDDAVGRHHHQKHNTSDGLLETMNLIITCVIAYCFPLHVFSQYWKSLAGQITPCKLLSNYHWIHFVQQSWVKILTLWLCLFFINRLVKLSKFSI